MMKAAVCSKYGEINVKNVAKPKIGPKDMLINVKVATVNRTDCANFYAKPFIMRFFVGLMKPKREIQGTELSGVVEAVGDEVVLFKPGQRIFGFNDQGMGSYAEYTVLKESATVKIMPENRGFDDGGPGVEGAHYAINMLNKVNIQAGQKILVNGATGGIGSSAVQILKYYGAHVTAVCGTEGIEIVRSLGADRIIDYKTTDFANETDQKYEYIFDTVGKSSFGKCKPLLKEHGVYISSELGFMAQNVFYALLAPILSTFSKNKKVIFPIPKDYMATLNLVKKLMEEEKFKAVIDKSVPLEEIESAFTYVNKGKKLGNLLIKLNN